MKRFALNIIIMFYVFALSFDVKANELVVDYKSFYSHARKINNDEMNALQFAFGFININSKKLCSIESARISTEKQQIPLEVSKENRFTIPVERALRLADAKVVLSLTEAVNICDMSVQLETKPEFLKIKYSAQELETLFTQYEAFFDDMGGFLSFMMPSVKGLNIYFKDQNLVKDLVHGLRVENGVLLVQQSQFVSLASIELPNKPVRITAHTVK